MPCGVTYSTGIARYRPRQEPMKRTWIFSLTSMTPSGVTLIVASNLSILSSRARAGEMQANASRKKAPARNQRFGWGLTFFIRVPSDGSRGRRGEADFRRFALGSCGYFEKLTRREAERAGKNIRGKLLDLNVEVAHDGI